MADMNNALLRNLYILEDESSPYGSASNTVYPATTLDQVFDPQTPDDKNLRTILEELHQEVISGGVGNIIFPVTSVNEMQGDVTITKYHIGLDNVDNTKDTEKPLSDPQRESVMDILSNYKFEVDLSDLYEHLVDSENPHNVTFEQVNNNGQVEEMISEAIKRHNMDEETHVDIRRQFIDLNAVVKKHMNSVEDHIGKIMDKFTAHLVDEKNAHITLFDKKEDKVNKVIDFETINNEVYPTTAAVSDYVDASLREFKTSDVDTLQRIIDIHVIANRNDLPAASEDELNHVYFIQSGVGIHNEIAICRLQPNGLDYGWDITTMDTITKFDTDYFKESSVGLTIDVTDIANEVMQNPVILLKLMKILNNAITENMKDYVRKDEVETGGIASVQSVQILTGTQSGTIRYQINDDADTMSEDIVVADINKLAYLDKVTEDYIEENAVQHQHIANRSIEHRHLQDQIVSAHNLRARYMHIFGNFEDKEGSRVDEIPLYYLVGIFKDALYKWIQDGDIMKWFKEELKDLLRQNEHEEAGWPDPTAHIRVYMDEHGDLIEECDYDDERFMYMYICLKKDTIFLEPLIDFKLVERNGNKGVDLEYEYDDEKYGPITLSIVDESELAVDLEYDVDSMKNVNLQQAMAIEANVDEKEFLHITERPIAIKVPVGEFADLIMDDDPTEITYQEMERCHYYIPDDGKGTHLFLDIKINDELGDSKKNVGDIEEQDYKVEGNQSSYAVINFTNMELRKVRDTSPGWRPTIHVKCPNAKEHYCSLCGSNYASECPVRFRYYNYDSDQFSECSGSTILKCGYTDALGENDIPINISIDDFRNPNHNGVSEYVFEFDWNGNGSFEQEISIRFDPKTVVLAEHDGDILWPEEPADPTKLGKVVIGHDYCERSETCDHSCCRVVGDNLPYTSSIITEGRYAKFGDDETWLPGVTLKCPYASEDGKSCSKHNAPADCHAKFLAHTPTKEEPVEFNGGENSCTSTSYGEVDVTVTVNPEMLEEAQRNHRNVEYIVECDWDEDGEYEQKVGIYVDPNKVTLIDDDEKIVWPKDIVTYDTESL